LRRGPGRFAGSQPQPRVIRSRPGETWVNRPRRAHELHRPITYWLLRRRLRWLHARLAMPSISTSSSLRHSSASTISTRETSGATSRRIAVTSDVCPGSVTCTRTSRRAARGNAKGLGTHAAITSAIFRRVSRVWASMSCLWREFSPTMLAVPPMNNVEPTLVARAKHGGRAPYRLE